MSLTLNDFLLVTQSKGSSAAIAQLEASDTPEQVAAAYDAFLRDAYWKLKKIDLITDLAVAGIRFCQRHAAGVADPAVKKDFGSWAKTLAYNFGSFAWPGWDEPGIALTATHIAQGLDAARLNLQLAVDLDKPADKVRNAHWLVGAQLLAAPHAGHVEEALAQFELALPPPPVPPPSDDEFFQLARGYVLLAKCRLGKAQAEGEWAAHLAPLKARSDEGARFAHAQLVTAFRVFNGPAS